MIQGAYPGPARADRAHLRVAARGPARAGAPLQLDLHPAAPRGLRPRPRWHRRHRGAGRAALPRADRHHPGVRRPLPVLPGELHRYRARLRGGDLRAGDGRVGADPGPEGDPEPPRHRGDGHPQRLRGPDRVVPPPREPAGLAGAVAPPAQRPRHRGGGHRGWRSRRARTEWRAPSSANGRAHRQRRPWSPSR